MLMPWEIVYNSIPTPLNDWLIWIIIVGLLCYAVLKAWVIYERALTTVLEIRKNREKIKASKEPSERIDEIFIGASASGEEWLARQILIGLLNNLGRNDENRSQTLKRKLKEILKDELPLSKWGKDTEEAV